MQKLAITKPFNGEVVAFENGTMLALKVSSEDKVKESAIAETLKNFDNASSLDIEILDVMENENCVSGELKIVVNQEEILFVVDVITFNNSGLISSIRAYLGRGN